MIKYKKVSWRNVFSVIFMIHKIFENDDYWEVNDPHKWGPSEKIWISRSFIWFVVQLNVAKKYDKCNFEALRLF